MADVAEESEMGGCCWDVKIVGRVSFEMEIREDLDVDHDQQDLIKAKVSPEERYCGRKFSTLGFFRNIIDELLN